jgi:enamine deaminase RidA (YjgF/YER057c/UK114 family)
MSKVEDKLKAIGITLPQPASPVANYVGWTKTGSLVFTAGQIPLVDGKVQHAGTCGNGVDIETAAKAARICAVNVLAQLKAACDGDLDRVVRIVKLVVFVASAPDFTGQPQIANGASDLMVEAFGDKGRHARSAVGVAALPANACVEVEAIVEIA